MQLLTSVRINVVADSCFQQWNGVAKDALRSAVQHPNGALPAVHLAHAQVLWNRFTVPQHFGAGP